MEIAENYLESVIKLFNYYKVLGDKAIEQLSPKQIFESVDSDKINSIAVIIGHLHGNMLSRWTDFLTTDGEKTWRNRDREFEVQTLDFELVMNQWEEGWQCLFDALNSVRADQLTEIIYIRNEGHTVMEAINRQLAHYPMHVGQIIFYAKLLKEGEWNSLSIPKGKSGSYNEAKFEQEKQVKNFTDDELDRLR
ncbi:DUF1572 family protein [Dyadobacter psychrotolerans]|uniref:DUF1572 domain-containing protein n=1 Tax=Dyadobacter psychrotolerans TaxID=2541721 RepID=A0A4R5DT84_9BACT|nr:DUF1572 family protein [Dyadobacter psychrotolerans]TDE17609.1 DUF1572 domain-containing protein [Dyadobacter psychrotolerans]